MQEPAHLLSLVAAIKANRLEAFIAQEEKRGTMSISDLPSIMGAILIIAGIVQVLRRCPRMEIKILVASLNPLA
jgi:hypothetical protein